MIKRLLVANRGEIARRVFRTCRRLGVGTVAVYSDADARAPHVREADQAVRLGPAAARESYLRAEAVLEAARATGADAIHPGYGFLSENAEFAEAVVAAGLIWVGPKPSSIRAMGLKDAAKRLMSDAGVPVTPGWLGEDQSVENLQKQAEAVGFPVLIKAVAGGGGKGMKQAHSAAEFAEALASAKREAAGAFGDDRVLLERYLTRPRHIEVQVFGDTHGNVVHLFERDCSLQRRHQKVIEEAPAPGMDPATREAVCAAAVRAAQAVDYVGAGTVEFIADASEGLRADRIFFMEMNTRLQVEHPVTEAVTGLDLVEWQLRVAAGEALPLRQDQIALNGHAVEARLYAEDPAKGFLPSTGRLEHFHLPADVRADSAVEQGGEVTPFYDPMIAKLIAHAPTRTEAAGRLAAACGAVEVWPVRTNAGFLVRCLKHADFVAGEVDTAFIPGRYDELTAMSPPSSGVLAAAGQAALQSERSGAERDPWSAGTAAGGFRLNAPPQELLRLSFGGSWMEAPIRPGSAGASRSYRLGEQIVAFEQGEAFAFETGSAQSGATEATGDGAILSPMPGRIVATSVHPGQTVEKGRPLVVLEAMKMEHALIAPFEGTVRELTVKAGDQVSEGVLLVRIEPA